MPDQEAEKDPLSSLMDQSQKGNQNAYKQLLSQIQIELKPLLIKKIANEEDREDILQNILIAIHNARHSYTPGRPFRPWMSAIANHKIIDYYRQKNRQSSRETDQEDTDFAWNDETQIRLETNEQIESLLGKVSQKQARILKYMKLEGLSVKETATLMEMSVSAVKVAAHRAYKKLKKEIEKES
ncbi:MAG: sigma-70 family RNA polymerase sigma factor [Spirochaetia bacterium]|nr:sigma-70 family RNA polymerase sigma factor [Spirochaetia bacterium]